MSFLQWILTNMEYFNFGSFFGVARSFLWWVANIIADLSGFIEVMYNNVFQITGVIYNKNVIGFIQTWLNYLYIPIIVSIVVLGYNLIRGNDEVDNNVRVKRFATNIITLLILVCCLPMVFLGTNSNQEELFSKSIGTGYGNYSGYSGGGDGVLSWFTKTDGDKSALISEIDGIGEIGQSGTYAQQTIVNNTYDLVYIYKQVADDIDNGNYRAITTNNFANYLNDGTYKKNQYYENLSAIKTLDYNRDIAANDCDDIFNESEDVLASQLVKNNYDVVTIKDNMGEKAYYDKEIANNEADGSANIDADSRLKGYEYVFEQIHFNKTPVSSGGAKKVYITNDGETKGFMDWDLFSTYPFRYSFDWGIMIITLAISCFVLFLTTYKIVKIIYEITVNQLLVLIFGAVDLSSGQKTKEIIKSIGALIASLVFSVILVEFYFILCNAVNGLQFENLQADHADAIPWIKCFITAFMGVAAIKGPSVLERIIGVEGGLGGSFRDISSAARTAKGAAKAVTKPVVKAAKLGGGLAAAGAIYGVSRHKGKMAAKADREASRRADGSSNDTTKVKDKTNRNSISANSKARNTEAGNTSQFTVAENSYGKTMDDQGTAIQDELSKVSRGSNADESRAKISEKYKGNIQNAALSYQSTNTTLSDKDALEKAYKESGFTDDEASRIASRDLVDGSYQGKKDAFDNSISKMAQDNFNANPTAYKNEHDAYVQAADEHYRSLGLNNAQANSLAENTGTRICLEDNQSAIRAEARNIQANETITETSDNGSTRDRKYTDEEAVAEAIKRQHGTAHNTGYLSSGHDQEYAKSILKSGTLNTGIKYGRVSQNISADSRTPNARAKALSEDGISGGMNPATYALFGFKGAMGEKAMKSAGYKAGYKKEATKRNHGRNRK